MRDFADNSKMQAERGSDSSSEEDEQWHRCVMFISELVEELGEGEAVSPATVPEKKRRAKYISRVVLRSPSECTWAVFITDNKKALEEDEFSPAGILFRQRFRVPYSMFCLVLGYAELWFPQADVNAAGIPACSTYLKVLGVLRVLGRAVCFDSVGECTNTHKEIHRVFFHKFVHQLYNFGRNKLQLDENRGFVGFRVMQTVEFQRRLSHFQRRQGVAYFQAGGQL